MSRPTLKTVADAAGVSVATASNAYNRPERMTPAVRARVLAVAERLGYCGPDPAGRSLRSRRSGSIGVLFATRLSYAFDDPYCVAFLAGVAEVAESASSAITLMPLRLATADGDPPSTDDVAAVRRAVVDGVLADGLDVENPALRLLATRGVPVVSSVDNPRGPCVVIDEVGAARAIGQHLASEGHSHVAVLVDSETASATESHGPKGLFPYAVARLQGLRSAFDSNASLQVVAAGGNSISAGSDATTRLLSLGRPPTAIVAVSDALALGALEAVRARGLRPGADVAVTGFDDIPASESAGLTTVRQPIREKGRIMARMLLNADFARRRIVLPTQLIIRESSRRRHASE